jgi:hypothetical protein
VVHAWRVFRHYLLSHSGAPRSPHPGSPVGVSRCKRTAGRSRGYAQTATKRDMDRFMAVGSTRSRSSASILAPFRFSRDTTGSPFSLASSSCTLSLARWLDEIEEFRFDVEHVPGRLNPADPLTRRPPPDTAAHVQRGGKPVVGAATITSTAVASPGLATAAGPRWSTTAAAVASPLRRQVQRRAVGRPAGLYLARRCSGEA